MTPNFFKYTVVSIFVIAAAMSFTAAYSQQIKITGSLKNSGSGKAVQSASVLLKNSLGRVIHFSISDNEGGYRLVIPDTARRNSLYIEVNSLGFRTIQQTLENDRNIYDFLMEETLVELKEVRIKNGASIVTKSDTLRYDVNAFARQEDRSIGDVIRHMPGMDVAENGQISYNGKNISNLYIHGDDLMDGSYGLATKIISKEMIRSVNILQNYQPIKVLKNKVPTDNVAVNLILKDENSLRLGGQMMLGAGLPAQYDVALNAIMLNQKFKMLNSVKSNNSGIDYRSDFYKFDASDLLSAIENTHPTALLSAITSGSPDIPRENYYLNNSVVLNANNLYNTKDSLQLKLNLQFYTDRNTIQYNTLVENYLPNDTISYRLTQNALRRPLLLNTSFTAEANKVGYYINDRLNLNFSKDDDFSTMDFNGKAFDQRLTGHTLDISNDFNWIPVLRKKGILSLRWYINYYTMPQHLYVGTGLDSDILNNNRAYSYTDQHISVPTFFSNFSTAYILGTNQFIRQSYGAGMITESQQLNSALNLTQLDGRITKYKGDAGNALNWNRTKIYLNADYGIKQKSWQANLSMPVFWQSIHYREDAYTLNHMHTRIIINPAVNLRLYMNTEDYLSASFNYKNNTNNIAAVYRGLILANYRSLSANDADILETDRFGSAITYNFQRSIIMLFMNAGVRYSTITANSILSTVLTNNVQRSVLIPYENEQNNLNVSAEISKYIFTLKTKVSVKSSWSLTKLSQFINGRELPFTNNTLSIVTGIDGKFFHDFTFNYLGTGNWSTSRQTYAASSEPKLENHFKRLDQSFAVGYMVLGNFFLNMKARHIFSTQPSLSDVNYLFLDMNMRYKLKKIHAELEFNCTNLLNIRKYSLFSVSSNEFAINSYDLRGRMAVVRLTINL